MIEIDGSQGEGGGQILRTALALSAIYAKPFRIEQIRAKRDKPGLLRQHLTAVNAAAAICGAHVEGAAIGSTQLTFSPEAVRGGDYRFSVGTAGSTMLVLQTVLPPLMIADAPSTLSFEGGTHNPFAPPFDFVDRAFLPIVRRMGPAVEMTLERAGFYPAGGGRFSVKITPTHHARLNAFDISERGPLVARSATAIVADLPGEIAKRELSIVRDHLGWEEAELKIRQCPRGWGPGNALLLELQSEHVTELITSFGMRGVTAEAVAMRAVEQARPYLAADVPVGPYLADQLLIPLALAGGGGFVTSSLSTHTTTNLEVIARFCERVPAVSGSGDRYKIHFLRSA